MASSSGVKQITLDTAPQMTVYELRQELERRNEYDWDAFPGYNALLQRMITLLVKEEEAVRQREHDAREKEVQQAKEERMRKKAERKAKAVARSLERQKAKDYFQKKEIKEDKDAGKTDDKIEG